MSVLRIFNIWIITFILGSILVVVSEAMFLESEVTTDNGSIVILLVMIFMSALTSFPTIIILVVAPFNFNQTAIEKD